MGDKMTGLHPFHLRLLGRLVAGAFYSCKVKASALGALFVLGAGTMLASPTSEVPWRQLHFRVGNQPAMRDVPRIGLNLSGRTSWGAEQYMANVLANPGFEPTLDGALAIVREVNGAEFTDDAAGLARASGFWKDAAFSVRTGSLAGLTGRILDSDVWKDYPHFRTDHRLAGLKAGDVVAVSREGAEGLPAQWWWQNPNRIRTSTLHPAQSPGVQSLVMDPVGTEAVVAVSYVDMIGDRAGKLLPLRGQWEADFWAKSEGAGQLTVQLRRINAAPFLHQTIHPSKEWHHYQFRFMPRDHAAPAGLEFRLEAIGAGSHVWIDDVSLSSSEASPSGVRPEVVETLKELHPGYLRDWQGQLGDTFANRIAPPGARRPVRYRPSDETAFGYSLPEFAELCHLVGANPWIVLPTTLRDDEWTSAGAWLHAALDHYGFREIVVEFGNENWNSLFRPAGVLDPSRLGEAAQRGFRLLEVAAGEDSRILPALGGQFVNPAPMSQALRKDPATRLIGIAPYYGRDIHHAARTEDEIKQLFWVDDEQFDSVDKIARESRKQAAIYEMNAHSLGASDTPEDVSGLVTSAASGSAILYHSLIAMNHGIYRQCLYSLAGFDTFRSDGKLVRLFGLSRDLAGPGHLRPTGLAMEMANRSLGGDAFDVTLMGPIPVSSEPVVAIRAFLSNGHWSIIAASGSDRDYDVTVELPPGSGEPPHHLLKLKSLGPLSNNESAEEVVLEEQPLAIQGGSVHFHLAPYGAVTAYTEPAGVPN